jgi:hypothetical protein
MDRLVWWELFSELGIKPSILGNTRTLSIGDYSAHTEEGLILSRLVTSIVVSTSPRGCIVAIVIFVRPLSSTKLLKLATLTSQLLLLSSQTLVLALAILLLLILRFSYKSPRKSPSSSPNSNPRSRAANLVTNYCPEPCPESSTCQRAFFSHT